MIAVRGKRGSRFFAVLALTLAAREASWAQDLHRLPAQSEITSEVASDDFVFGLHQREHSVLAVIAGLDGAFDLANQMAIEGASAGLKLYTYYELLLSFRHLWLWRGSGAHATFAAAQAAWRLPLCQIFALRIGIELGFAPSGLVAVQGRAHLELRAKLARQLELGAALFNPAYTLFRRSEEQAEGWRWSLLSELELRVSL